MNSTPIANATNSRRWLVLIAMTASLSMVLLDGTIISVALPSLHRDLGFSATGIEWVVNAYTLALAALVAFGGRLGDVRGRVSTYRLGVIIFFVASALCALAPAGEFGPGWLVACRVLQGVGAATMIPTSTAIVVSEFQLAERGRALAVYNGISMIFMALGPLLGGLLVETVSWRAIFWINVPIGLAALVLVRIARPANNPMPGKLSVPDLALLVTGLVGSVLALQQGGVWGWNAPETLVSLGIGLVALLVFVVRQMRSTTPLLNLRLFGISAFRADSIVVGLLQAALLPIVVFAPIFLQTKLGMSPIEAGTAMLPLILSLAIGAQIAGRWLDRSGVRAPALTGTSIATVGLALWALSIPVDSFAAMVPGMIVAGFGIGLTLSPSLTDALNRVTAMQRGQGAGLTQTVRQVSGSVGLAAATAVSLAITNAQPASGTVQVHATTAVFVLSTAVMGVGALVALRLLPRGRQLTSPDASPVESHDLANSK